jgi:DNA-binding PadR family transcriptional regulator
MAKGDWLGEFEQIVMLAVMRLAGDAYGMEVRREIAQRTGRDTAIGAVYATLERLREKGFLQARESAPESPTGRMRRAYKVTAEGRRAVEQALSAVAKMREGVRLSPGKATP